MPVERHFLGWDGPLAGKVAAYLLADTAAASPVDLSATWVMVPTRQAGRCLRQELLRRTGGLLPPRLITPASLLMDHGVAAASATAVTACWLAVLGQEELKRYPALFPEPATAPDTSALLGEAVLLQQVREQLAEGGYRVADIAARTDLPTAEAQRWREFAAIEAVYEQRLAAAGLVDRLQRQLELAQKPQPDMARLLVAGVPDPIPLVVTALQNLAAAGCRVEILIHAPASEASSFDAFGRPLVAAWQQRTLDWSGRVELLMADNPAAGSRQVLAKLADFSQEYTPEELAVGVADSELTPFLLADLEGHELRAYDPAGQRCADHALYHLLRHWYAFNDSGRWQQLAQLVRHPDFLSFLQHGHGLEPVSLLTQLDLVQNRYLLQTWPELVRLWQRRHGELPQYAVLWEAVAVLDGLVRQYGRRPVAGTASLLAELYRERQLDQNRRPDRDFVKVSQLLRTVLTEVEELAGQFELTERQWSQLLLARFAEQVYYPDHDDAAVALVGWLELAWQEAPVLLLTGMNQGRIPAAQAAHPLLPDSLCQRLGIRHNQSLFCRDLFLLQSMLCCRRHNDGRMVLFCLKHSLSGEPLRPSRLLFAAADSLLLARAGYLFDNLPSASESGPVQVDFRLDVGRVKADNPDFTALSVTALRDYLACPFRFYLRRELGMRHLEDSKLELDPSDFGSLAHQVLESLGRELINNPTGDAGAMTDFLQRRLAGLGREYYGAAPPLSVVLQLEALAQRLAGFARLQAELHDAGWRIEQVESEVTFQQGAFTVSGRIDRIDRHLESGCYRILDYKTSDTAKDPAAEHLGPVRDWCRPYAVVDGRRWLDLQLPLYLLLVAQRRGVATESISVGYLQLPKAVSETGLALWERFDARLLEAARVCLDGVLADLAAGRFWPPAPQVPYDDFAELMQGEPAACFIPRPEWRVTDHG